MNRVLALTFVSIFFYGSIGLAGDLQHSDRVAVVGAIISHLETDYVNAAVGKKAADALRGEMAGGALTKPMSGAVFAETLGNMLQKITGDGHLNVDYSENRLAETTDGVESFSADEMERWYGAHLNFGVERVERLEGNIGLIDLRVFAPIDMGGDTVAAAMNVIAHTESLIIDLRNNGGGIGDMANLVASYLFDSEPRALTGTYDRPSDTLTQQFTQAHVPGARFGPDKPVYVLISPATFSAAEALAYNLQALERAVIVGEASGGGAHPFEYVRIHPHFVLWSVTARSVNPLTGGNWQGVGVQPDISVPADEALEAALLDIRGPDRSDKSER